MIAVRFDTIMNLLDLLKEIRETIDLAGKSKPQRFLILAQPRRCVHCQNRTRILIEDQLLNVLANLVIEYSVFLERDCECNQIVAFSI